MVFSSLNPLNFFRNFGCKKSANQTPFPETDRTVFMDLPREVRVKILGYLKIQDLRNVRLVSEPLRWEIDNGVGLHVNLLGPKPWKDWDFDDDKRCLLSLGNPEPRRVEHNINWISSSYVQGLNISRLSGLSFDPLTLISNPFVLQRLVIQLNEDTSQGVKILEMLSVYNSLRTLSVTCFAPRSTLRFTEGRIYRQFCNGFIKEVLDTLLAQTRLKEFTIRVDTRLPFGYGHLTFLGTSPDPIGEPVKYPSTLNTLKLHLPIIADRQNWMCWKALLDIQTELRDLEVYIGFPYWDFFTDVMNHNARTLRTIDLKLSNWSEPRTFENWPDPVPEIEELDWSVLLPNPAQLTSVKISMSTPSLRLMELIPGSTRGFALIPFDSLETLELRSITLVAADFLYIFGNLPNLKNVCLTHWNRIDTGNFTPAALAACEPLANALLGNRFERIRMNDHAIPACPQNIRETISSRVHYRVVWPRQYSTELNMANYVFGTGTTLFIKKICI